ncbi:AraC family transcriptional regulator [Caulobacter segnis]|uniref:AraC family transcriptional regulator n=1 Tax=Caulobacter segnis TaxID=88688 RepID=UPI0028585A8D|nr:AraC family transcriptional regulator [Caulobacter segnis]MDR6626015.1 AraC-like DNA-binding protein [Caulobacter segnis]
MNSTLLSLTLDTAPATPPKRPGRLAAHWALTSGSLACFVLGQLLGANAGMLAAPLAIGGGAGCAFSWLFTRALFDPREHDARWSRIVALVVFLTGVFPILGLLEGPAARMIQNTHALGSSTVLLLTFVEPFNGFGRELPAAEKRFRVIFVAVYALLMGSSVLAVNQPAGAGAAVDHDVAERVKTVCASLALLLCGGAVWFRARHPLATPRGRRGARASQTPDDADLARRITRLLREEEIQASPSLKVADLARRLGEPDYKVTRCITASLGFANFNQMLNVHRVARAREMLADPALRGRSILLIALDCGFGSIGPFNRAFKAVVGVTPRAFRGASLGDP